MRASSPIDSSRKIAKQAAPVNGRDKRLRAIDSRSLFRFSADKEAKRIADDVAVMFDGRLIEYSPAQELFSAPKQQLTREFLAGIYG